MSVTNLIFIQSCNLLLVLLFNVKNVKKSVCVYFSGLENICDSPVVVTKCRVINPDLTGKKK